MAVKIIKNLLVSVTLGLSLQAPSFAAEPGNVATLNDAQGTVMVDQGKGFVTTKVNAPFFENDRVITLDGSAAEIVFSDGCRTTLKANSLITINLNPGCKAAILDVTKVAPQAVAAANHPLSFVPALGGVGIGIAILSISNE